MRLGQRARPTHSAEKWTECLRRHAAADLPPATKGSSASKPDAAPTAARTVACQQPGNSNGVVYRNNDGFGDRSIHEAICESIAQAATRFVLSHCTVSLLNEPALGRIIIENRDRGSARHDWKGGYHDRQEHFGQQARRSRHD